MRRRSYVLALAGLAGCGTPDSREGTTAQYTASVSVRASDAVTARVVVADDDTGDWVYDERHDLEPLDRLDLSDAFDPGRGYVVRVLIDGEVEFERTVYAYEEYVLRIANGDVTVEAHGER
ncbi:hypothetical protein [Halostella pelagica]|uniref:hypothetical protein n=1 Tax=Halostella pelagica TaxID=2583824 RepID=UPI00108227D8|nr:hypothetical protein [Halostella pelagica]